MFSHLLVINRILIAALQETGSRDDSLANKTLSILPSRDALTHTFKESSEQHMGRICKVMPNEELIKMYLELRPIFFFKPPLLGGKNGFGG